MPTLPTEILFDLDLRIGERHAVGQTPFGDRRISHVIGGRFAGPALSGRVLPGSGDWPLVTAAGAMRIDARLTLETEGGDIVYMTYRGMRSAPPEVIERLNRGEEVDPSSYYLRIAPFFEAPARYEWLNYVLSIGIGRRIPGGIHYEVHRVL